MDHFRWGRRVTLLVCFLMKTYIQTYVGVHTYTSVRSYFNCFAGAGYFQSNLGNLLKSSSIHSEIHGFILPFLKRKAHLRQDHWVGAAHDGGSEVGLALTRRTDKRERRPPDQPVLTSQERSVGRKRPPAAQPPRVARRCTSSRALPARLSRTVKMSEPKSTWGKKNGTRTLDHLGA